jgi:hypothetical protein
LYLAFSNFLEHFFEFENDFFRKSVRGQNTWKFTLAVLKLLVVVVVAFLHEKK